MTSTTRFLMIGGILTIACGVFIALFLINRVMTPRAADQMITSEEESPPQGETDFTERADRAREMTAEGSSTRTDSAVPLLGSGSVGITTLEPLNIQSLGLGRYPNVRETYTDPVFGTSLLRFTDATDRNDYANHDYSQLQAFSADSEYIIVNEADGTTVRRVADGSRATLEPFRGNTVRWHLGIPHTLFFFDSNEDTTIRAQTANVDTGEIREAFIFPDRYDRIRVNQSFDEMSEDGRWVTGMAAMSDDDDMIFALDLTRGEITVEISLSLLYRTVCEEDPDYGILEPDWVSPSPLGNYLVVNWARDGAERCSGQEVYDIRTGRYLGHSYDGRQHGDLAVHPDGSEIFVTDIPSPIGDGLPAIGYYTLPDGVETPTFIRSMPWHGIWHISCRGPRGVCAITSFDPEPDWDLRRVLDSEIYLLYFDGAVRRLTHHRSSGCGYWVQPRATISGDGRYIAFDSDYNLELGGPNSCATVDPELGGGEVFLILLPEAAKYSPGGASRTFDL